MLRPVHAIDTLLSDRGFWIAFSAAGMFALVALAARRRTPITVGTVAGAGGALVGLWATDRWSNALAVAVALLVIGAIVTSDRRLALRVVAMLPGAVLIGLAVGNGTALWMRVAAGFAALVLASGASSFEREQTRVAGLIWAVSALGVFATVPDTEQARALVGGTLVIAVLSLVHPVVDGAGGAALAGLLCWTAAVGGQARPGAVIGALGCAGVFGMAPLVRRVRPPVAVLLTVHVVLVLVSSRVAGLRQSAWIAGAIVIGVVAAASIALWLFRGDGAQPDVGVRRPASSR